MTNLNHSTFRKRAIEKYMRREEQDILLQLASPPMFAFLWILVFFSLGAAVFVSLLQVPIFISGEGMVIKQSRTNGRPQQEIIVLLLFPPNQQRVLRKGEIVNIRITPANGSFSDPIALNCVVDDIAADVMSPNKISTQFDLSPPLAEIASEPAQVVTAHITSSSLASMYLGSQGRVEVQIGSESAFFMIPGIDNLLRLVRGVS